MRPKTLPHILERNVTRASNILRRGGWLHHEYVGWARFPGWNENDAIPLQEIEFGRRVSDGLITEAINKRVHGSPFGKTRIVR